MKRKPSSPCVKCGFCCTQSVCAYGIWNEEKHQCKYLTEEKLCKKYKHIVRSPYSGFSPAFGGGCCSSLCNPTRQKKIAELSKLHP